MLVAEKLLSEIYNILNGDSVLMSKVNYVGDFVPRDTALPYIKLSAVKVIDKSGTKLPNYGIELELEIYSNYLGKKELFEINELVGNAIKGHDFSANSCEIYNLKFENSSIKIDKTGKIHSSMLLLSCNSHG